MTALRRLQGHFSREPEELSRQVRDLEQAVNETIAGTVSEQFTEVTETVTTIGEQTVVNTTNITTTDGDVSALDVRVTALEAPFQARTSHYSIGTTATSAGNPFTFGSSDFEDTSISDVNGAGTGIVIQENGLYLVSFGMSGVVSDSTSNIPVHVEAFRDSTRRWRLTEVRSGSNTGTTVGYCGSRVISFEDGDVLEFRPQNGTTFTPNGVAVARYVTLVRLPGERSSDL